VEKAVRAEEKQQWQMLMESVGRKSGRLERNLPGRGRKPWRGRRKMPYPRSENRM